MTSRTRRSLLGLALTVVALAATAHPAGAQGISLPPLPGAGLGELVANPGEWIARMFNAALVGLVRQTTGDVVDFMGWLLGNDNVISQTPAGLSYASPVVIRLWETVRLVANAALAVVTVWGGVNIVVHPHIRAPYHGALELVPRVLLSAILVNTSLEWGHFVIDLNNALCQALGATSMPAWQSVQTNGDAGLMQLVALAIYLVMGLLLLVQMLMRLALVDALLAIAPLALVCWVLPQTYEWARLWFSTFFGTVFVQSIQVMVLLLGSELIQHLPTLVPSPGSASVDSGRTWLMTLLLGVAALQLARMVPRLMPGFPGGSAITASGAGAIRQVGTLLRSTSGQRRPR